MLFNLEQDRGAALSGYVVPEGFRGRAQISVSIADREVWRTQTFEPRAALVQAGRHETGLCGYTVDETVVADLSDVPDLAVHDMASGLLVARRCPATAVLAHRVVRLETHLLPLRALDLALLPRFRFGYVGLDRHGGETASQVFLLNDGGSLYASGRLSYRSVQGALEPAASGVIVIRDPVLELAERLIVLNRVGVGRLQLFGERDAMTWQPAVAFAAALDWHDLAGVRRALEAMPARVSAQLASPLARLLAAQPDEDPRTRHVAPALRTLSRLTLVGLREHWGEFRERLAALLGLEPEALPMVGELPAVAALAAELRPLRVVRRLLAVDLELYARIRDAVEAGCTDGPAAAGAATGAALGEAGSAP